MRGAINRAQLPGGKEAYWLSESALSSDWLRGFYLHVTSIYFWEVDNGGQLFIHKFINPALPIYPSTNLLASPSSDLSFPYH